MWYFPRLWITKAHSEDQTFGNQYKWQDASKKLKWKAAVKLLPSANGKCAFISVSKWPYIDDSIKSILWMLLANQGKQYFTNI